MSVSVQRMLKSVYRKEPITSLVITAGAVDAVIGGLNDRWSLFTFGIGAISVAIAMRWWQFQNHQIEQPKQVGVRALPPQSSSAQLPPLSVSSKKRPSQHL
jgi:hypothetical protein